MQSVVSDMRGYHLNLFYQTATHLMLITVHMPTAFGHAKISQSGRKWMQHRSCHQFMRKGLVDLLRLGRSRLMRYKATMGKG
jgi:hypothetical protein